jgi:hypothetical protein
LTATLPAMNAYRAVAVKKHRFKSESLIKYTRRGRMSNRLVDSITTFRERQIAGSGWHGRKNNRRYFPD